MPAEQAQTGDADFRLWRAGDHRAVEIAHNNVTDAHGGAAIGSTLDLRSADFYPLAAAEILFDRGHQPRAESVELNRAAREPPPQAGAAEHQHADEDAAANRDAFNKLPMPRQKTPIGGEITAVGPALAATRRCKIGPASRVNNGLAPRGRLSDLAALFAHARSGVPSSVASSQRYTTADRINAPRSTPLPAGVF